jgi:hypothetical protein
MNSNSSANNITYSKLNATTTEYIIKFSKRLEKIWKTYKITNKISEILLRLECIDHMNLHSSHQLITNKISTSTPFANTDHRKPIKHRSHELKLQHST